MARLKFMQQYALEEEGVVPPSGDGDDNAEPIADLSTVTTEITNTQDELVSLESRLNDLAYLADSIGSTGGMSQRFAMEAEKLLPGFGGVPVQYYTKEPTATRLKVAMEEIEHGIAALIALAVAAVLTIIYKIYRWFKGSSSGDASADDAVASVQAMSGADDKMKANLAADAKILGSTKYVFDKIPGGIKVGDHIVHNFNDAIRTMMVADNRESDVSKFLDGNDPFLHDFVTEGPLFKAVMEAGRLSGSISERIAKQDQLLSNIAIGDLNGTAKAAELTTQLDDFDRNSTFTFHGKEKTVSEIRTELSELTHKLDTGTVNGKVSLDELNDRCTKAINEFGYQHVVDSLVTGLKAIAKVEEASKSLSARIPAAAKDDGTVNSNSKELGSRIRDAFFKLNKEMAAYAGILWTMRTYAEKLEHYMRQRQVFVRLVLLEMKKHFAELKKNKLQGTMPVDYDTALEKFEQDFKEWEKERTKRAKAFN